MIDFAAEGYRRTELTDCPDNELLSLLKKHWGYQESDEIDIFGRLAVKFEHKGKNFYILEELHNLHDGRLLRYPVNEPVIKHNVFVGVMSKKKLGKEVKIEGSWVTARVELSPSIERLKILNPMGLSAIMDTITLLQPITLHDISNEIMIDGQSHVEKWVCDAYLSANLNKLTEIVDEEQQRADTFLTKNDQLQQQITLQESSLSNLNNAFQSTIREKQQTEAELKQLKTDMEYKLKTLRQFIEQRTQMLVELDLVSQQDCDNLLGNAASKDELAGHDFNAVFDGDLSKAVSYVQAYMEHKGSVYQRAVLEDFCTLLSTHDLIVLAGDSGSGKTNLVKSFADAVGGKAIIIPVKPNWTSAEDLLGYYNPIEQKFLSTPFLDALLEAAKHPDVPYFICLDEMNLARVEYYFADFLSAMEERSATPTIPLFSDVEAQHLVSETKNFLSLVLDVKEKLEKTDAKSFLDLLRDEQVNAKLHEICGFKDGDSLLKYHARLRRLFSSYLSIPSRLVFPANVRVIGAINVDETTHYLSPKILDRAHIMRFSSPLLSDWSSIQAEIEGFDVDLDLPVLLKPEIFGSRQPYPAFDPDTELVKTLIGLVRNFLEPLGIEFGLRTVRQAQNYAEALQRFGASDELVLNNIVLHKVLPKLMFDGEKIVNGDITRKDILKQLRDTLSKQLETLNIEADANCINELDRVIRNAIANDWVVNYWSR